MWTSLFGGDQGIPVDKHVSPKGRSMFADTTTSDSTDLDLETGASPFEKGRAKNAGALMSIDEMAAELENMPLDNAYPRAKEKEGNLLSKFQYETAMKLQSRLEMRDFERKDQAEHVRLADVEGEMLDLTMGKDNDESIGVSVIKSLEALTKKTVFRGSKDAKLQLDAARICQIENRLKFDPSLQIEKKSDGTPLWEFPENPAEFVKKKLIKT
ncbi:unnamed protein product, partial [Effrenium voratum]